MPGTYPYLLGRLILGSLWHYTAWVTINDISKRIFCFDSLSCNMSDAKLLGYSVVTASFLNLTSK